MLKGICKQWLLVFILLLASLYGVAQQYHFLYIQADNQQPFYVKYGGKNYSSSAIGYLILPKLSDGTFSLQIGFPKNLYPEQNFNLAIAGKDLGYALKNFNEKGWGLFNFQTTDVVMNGNSVTNIANEPSVKTTTNNGNAFGNMLASAINDSTLNQQRTVPTDSAAKTNAPTSLTVVKDTLQTTTDNKIVRDTTKTIADAKPLKDSASAALQTSSQPYSSPAAVDSLVKKYAADSNSTIANKTVADSNQIIKSSENKTSSGTDLTFLDKASKDTIHAFIPSSNTNNAESKTSNTDSAKEKINNPFFNSNTAQTNTPQPTLLDSNSNTNTNSKLNTSCNKMFSNNDADKLKKKIISLINQDEILNAVRKSLRDKCISTDQVKDLGNLFLSDENRYSFYDVAYPFVYDYGNYAQLQNTLIDTYYKNRFKALLR